MGHVDGTIDPAGRTPDEERPAAARERPAEGLTKFMMTVAALEFGLSVGNLIGSSLS